MRKTIMLLLALVLISILSFGCGGSQAIETLNSTEAANESDPLTNKSSSVALETAPQLDVFFDTNDSNEQSIRAIQGTTSWLVVDENGDGFGYNSDSPHPLQLRLEDYAKATIHLSNLSRNTVELRFSDDHPPESLHVRRWDSVHAQGNQDIDAILDAGETENVIVIENMMQIGDYGGDHIYEVVADWPEGRSHYSFRIINEPENIKTEWSMIYIQTIESYLLQFPELHENLEYISLTSESFYFANEADKEYILKYFEDNYYPVIDAYYVWDEERQLAYYEGSVVGATHFFDEERRMSYYEKDDDAPDGVWFRMEGTYIYDGVLIVQGWRYRNDTDHNMFETRWAINADGSYTMLETVNVDA